MSSKNNYKAKWEALKAEKETGVERVLAAKPVLQTAQSTNTNAILEFNKVHKSLMETASAAKSLVTLMDEFRQVGTITFGECGGLIDEKIAQLDMQTIARRTRDVLKLSAARIGVLSAAYDELESKVDEMSDEIQSLLKQTRSLQNTLVSSVYIGHKPSSSELEDMTDQKSKYKRFGVEYQDLGDDWEETALFENGTLRERRRNDDDSDDDKASDTSEDDYTTTTAVSKLNRSAQVIPRSHVQDIVL